MATNHKRDGHGGNIRKLATVAGRPPADILDFSANINPLGYEIHHGQTEGRPLIPVVLRQDKQIIGVGTESNRIWGTYLHGIFDADEFRRWFIDRLRVRRNLLPIGKVCAVYDLEPAYERLAEVVRRSLKMDEIYRLAGLRRGK